jgi:F1F0 ATPase subunit 2
MNGKVMFAAAAAGGFCLGLLFFGGLWFTIRKSLFSRVPWLWFLLSMAVRTTMTLSGFLFLTGGDLQRLFFCLGGFSVAKICLIWPSRHAGKSSMRKEGDRCI